MKNDDVERLLLRLTPRGLGSAARTQVLAAVASVLRKEPASPWTRRFAWAVAAALLFGIALNVWVSKSTDYRLAQLFGPPPVSKEAKELADTIESVAGAQTARWVYERCAAARSSGDGRLAYEAYCDRARQLTNELSNPFQESEHETPQKDPQVDRNRRGRPRGDRTDCQRPFYLDYRITA
jgi:hypothetical protein